VLPEPSLALIALPEKTERIASPPRLMAISPIVIYGIPILLLLTFFFWLLFGKTGLMKKLWRVTVGKK
jgi:hypothetical protein